MEDYHPILEHWIKFELYLEHKKYLTRVHSVI